MKREQKPEKKPHSLRKNPHGRESWILDKRAGRPRQRWEINPNLEGTVFVPIKEEA